MSCSYNPFARELVVAEVTAYWDIELLHSKMVAGALRHSPLAMGASLLGIQRQLGADGKNQPWRVAARAQASASSNEPPTSFGGEPLQGNKPQAPSHTVSFLHGLVASPSSGAKWENE